MSILEKLGYGGQVMLIGLLIVFAVLILLIWIISGLSKVVSGLEGKGGEEQPEAAPAPAPVPATPAQQADVAAADDPQLIAVIAAALAAYDQSGKLIVRSVRRVTGWKNAGRNEQVYRF